MASMTNDWVIARASVQGKSHVDGGIVNQDAMALVNPLGNDCFAVAISDGAGSAKRADEGSQHFSHEIAHGLHKLVTAVHRHEVAGNSQNTIADYIQQLITDARKSLNVGDSTLRDFHCNLMALAMGPDWGIMVYLGDAVMLKSAFASSVIGADFFVNASMSLQDRAEYANETHFLTEPDWPRHLVWNFINPKGQDDLFALMTDGAADIALGPVPGSTDKEVSRPFFAPLVSLVMTAPAEDERNRVIYDALASPQTYKLTGDDKTMVLVIRRSKLALGALVPVVEKQKSLEKDKDGAPADGVPVPVPVPVPPIEALQVGKSESGPIVRKKTAPVPSAIAVAERTMPQHRSQSPSNYKFKRLVMIASITVAAVCVIATSAIAGYVFMTRTPKVVGTAEKTNAGTVTIAPIQAENLPALAGATTVKPENNAEVQNTSKITVSAPVATVPSAVAEQKMSTVISGDSKVKKSPGKAESSKKTATNPTQTLGSTPKVALLTLKPDEKSSESVKGTVSPVSASN